MRLIWADKNMVLREYPIEGRDPVAWIDESGYHEFGICGNESYDPEKYQQHVKQAWEAHRKKSETNKKES